MRQDSCIVDNAGIPDFVQYVVKFGVPLCDLIQQWHIYYDIFNLQLAVQKIHGRFCDT